MSLIVRNCSLLQPFLATRLPLSKTLPGLSLLRPNLASPVDIQQSSPCRYYARKRPTKAASTPPSNNITMPQSDENKVVEIFENSWSLQLPQDENDKRAFFKKYIETGDKLYGTGNDFYSAACYYYASLVCPCPPEVINFWERTLPLSTLRLLLQFLELDAKKRAEVYYDYFPRKNMNVAIRDVEVTQTNGDASSAIRQKILVCTKDFQPGELIYKEEAIATALDPDLRGRGTHCNHCLRVIEEQDTVVRPNSDRFNSVYCSEDCHDKAHTLSQRLLFTPEPLLARELFPFFQRESHIKARQYSQGLVYILATGEAPDMSVRDRAQTAFAEHLQRTGKAAPELLARLLARQVAIDMFPMLKSQKLAPIDPKLPLTDEGSQGGHYSFLHHLDRLRYLDVVGADETAKLLIPVLENAIPGLEYLATEEQLSVFLGAVTYNAFGVYFGEGRNDKPAPTARPEDMERTRTPVGTQKQVGAGFYAVSSYLSHSCEPSARPCFCNGTSELHLIANRALKAGDELTVAYVDVNQHERESAEECQRRSRFELSRGWGLD